jgi:hypothetical protein
MRQIKDQLLIRSECKNNYTKQKYHSVARLHRDKKKTRGAQVEKHCCKIILTFEMERKLFVPFVAMAVAKMTPNDVGSQPSLFFWFAKP